MYSCHKHEWDAAGGDCLECIMEGNGEPVDQVIISMVEARAQITTLLKENEAQKQKLEVAREALEDIRPWIDNACEMIRDGQIVRQSKDGSITRFKDEGWFFNPAERIHQALSKLSNKEEK